MEKITYSRSISVKKSYDVIVCGADILFDCMAADPIIEILMKSNETIQLKKA